MSYVSEVSSDEAPTVLIVDNNQMSIMRLREVFKKRGFATQVCEDGDLAVDEYIKLDPELVVMSLDIPSLDGHLAALEMREHGGDSRILFIAPNRLRELAVHATYSAGAVGWLAKPVSQAQLDEIWDQVLGPIPEAPEPRGGGGRDRWRRSFVVCPGSPGSTSGPPRPPRVPVGSARCRRFPPGRVA